MGWEAALLLWIQGHLRGGMDEAVAAFTHLGDGGGLFIALGMALLCFPRTRRAGAAVLTALLLGALVTNVTLKPLVDRTRPWLAVEGLRTLVTERDLRSFPSGHSTAAFAFAGAMLCSGVKRRWKGLCLLLAAAMAFSRLYVGVHYPTDVLAGIVIGLAAGRAGWKIGNDLADKWNRHKKSSS